MTRLPENYTGLFGDTIVIVKRRKVNPCIALYGAGPELMRCRTCVHLRVLEYARKYYKCELRVNTHGAGSDHRRSWPACGRYEIHPKQLELQEEKTDEAHD